MMKQPEGKSFVIIDDKSMKASKRLQGFKQKGYFVEAPTVAELAKKIGVPAENLEKTIKRYSEFVKNGKDEDFGRKYNMKTDFTTPPYYATSTTPGVQTTPGGVKTTPLCRLEQLTERLFLMSTLSARPLKGLLRSMECGQEQKLRNTSFLNKLF